MFKLTLASLALARLLDANSTCSALNQPGSTTREANPLLPSNCKTAIVVQTSIAALQVYGLNKLHKNHPKLANTVAYITIGIEAFAVVNNTKIK